MPKRTITVLQAQDGPLVSVANPPRIKLDTVRAIRREMARVYREARAGMIDTGDANRLTWMLRTQIEAYSAEVFEQRLHALEQVIPPGESNEP